MGNESLNPYQANIPHDDGPSEEWAGAENVKLFSAFSVGLATFLGSMFAGSILMGINYRRLGRPGEAIAIILGGLLATAAFLSCVVFFLPEWIPGLIYLGVQVLVAWSVFQQLQGRVVSAHRRAGGAMASVWWGALLALLVSVPIAGVLFGVDAAMQRSLGQRLAVGGDEVYISGSSTEADGRWLAARLKEAEWFEGDGAAATLHRSREKFTVSLFVANDYVSDQETTQFLTDFGRFLADERLGHPLEMRLLDENLSIKEKVPIP